MSAFAVVPVKTLLKSKTRLSHIFTLQERSLFTLAMLEDVLKALKDSEVDESIVVGSDSAVEEFAKRNDAMFLRERREGLNQAVCQATELCVEREAAQVLVLLADVPLVEVKDINQLLRLVREETVAISPSWNGGTNALLQKPPRIIEPCFGVESFRRHAAAAQAKQKQTRIYASANIMLDIDSEEDLSRLANAGKHTASSQFLSQSGWSRKSRK